MTNEELVLLIQADVDKRDNLLTLYQKNIHLIRKVVRRFAFLADPEDLEQEAYIALQTAAETWAPEGGAAFSTYAYRILLWHLGRYAREVSSPFRVSEYMSAQITAYHVIISQYESIQGRPPTQEEMRSALGVSDQQLQIIISTADQEKISSLEEVLPGTEGGVLADIIADPENGVDELLDQISKEEINRDVRKLLHHLPDREREIIELRFFQGKTLTACAAELGISPSSVRDTQRKALRKLRGYASRESWGQDVYSLGIRGSGIRSYRASFTSSTERAALDLASVESDWLQKKDPE